MNLSISDASDAKITGSEALSASGFLSVRLSNPMHRAQNYELQLKQNNLYTFAALSLWRPNFAVFTNCTIHPYFIVHTNIFIIEVADR